MQGSPLDEQSPPWATLALGWGLIFISMARGYPKAHPHAPAGLFVSIQCHPQPLQLLPLFGSSIFLSTCVPCFCCWFLPFSVIVWVATLCSESRLWGLNALFMKTTYVVSPELSVLAYKWVATWMRNSQQSKINTEPKWAVSNQYLLSLCLLSFLFCLSFPLPSSCSRYSPSIHSLFLYFYYVFSMSIYLYFPTLEQ